MMRRIAHFTVALVMASCFAVHAYAQDADTTPSPAVALPDGCMDLDNNPEWNTIFSELTANYKAKEFEAALMNGEKLKRICERSPVLNFSIGRIYREMGDDTKGLYYMQRATMFTEEFQVKGLLLERMWYERYEIEHIDAREEVIAERKKLIEDQQTEIEQLKADVQQRDTELMELKAQTTLDRNTALLNERSHYAAGMWSGVGIGGLGVILAIAGGVLLNKNKDDAVKFSDEERKAWPKDSTYLYTGLLASGVALTVAGAVLAGFMGYHYARTPVPDVALDLAIGPTGASFSLAF